MREHLTDREKRALRIENRRKKNEKQLTAGRTDDERECILLSPRPIASWCFVYLQIECYVTFEEPVVNSEWNGYEKMQARSIILPAATKNAQKIKHFAREDTKMHQNRMLCTQVETKNAHRLITQPDAMENAQKSSFLHR